MRLVGRGDERIRATHPKTLELIAGAQLTERATCVIAVRTAAPTQRLAGPVHITISAGEETFDLDAHANSSWNPAGAAVIRRGPLRLPGTLATHASAGAADLPRTLVQKLRDPATTVTVTIERRPTQPCLVLFAADPETPDDPRLAAELAAADVVVAEDDGARRLVGAGNPPARISQRVLVVATVSLPGVSVPRAAVPVETVGLAPPLAAAAAAPWDGPVVLADRGDATQLLRRAPAGCRLSLETDRRGLPALLRRAGQLRGSTAAMVAREFDDPVLVSVDDPGEFAGADRLFACLGPGSDDLDPAVRQAVGELLADGIATRSAARALAALTGWPQRRAYDTVLSWRG